MSEKEKKKRYFKVKRKSDGATFLYRYEKGKKILVGVKNDRHSSMYSGHGIEFMPCKRGMSLMRDCAGDPCTSPAVLWVKELLEKNGIYKSPKQVWFNFTFFVNSGLLEYDEESGLWTGTRYDPCADDDEFETGADSGDDDPGEYNHEEAHADDY